MLEGAILKFRVTKKQTKAWHLHKWNTLRITVAHQWWRECQLIAPVKAMLKQYNSTVVCYQLPGAFEKITKLSTPKFNVLLTVNEGLG